MASKGHQLKSIIEMNVNISSNVKPLLTETILSVTIDHKPRNTYKQKHTQNNLSSATSNKKQYNNRTHDP